MAEQLLSLYPNLDVNAPLPLPSTRYQSSKAKLIHWIWEHVKSLDFKTVLDAFGESGAVSYWMKQHCKQVTCNDYLRSNYYIGVAIIENSCVRLKQNDIQEIITPMHGKQYSSFIADCFRDIYYNDAENRWLDVIVQNLEKIDNVYKQALGYYALIQSCLVKRPFNLFHCRNLYLRLVEVPRSIGNKPTWDKPFEKHFLAFFGEANRLVLNNGLSNHALNMDALELDGDYNLIYFDPPYTSASGVTIYYRNFYQFLGGLVNYKHWGEWIDHATLNKRLRRKPNLWNEHKHLRDGFRAMFEKFRNSVLVVSYRYGGIPLIEEIAADMKQFKRHVSVFLYENYQYALSPRRTPEVIIEGLIF